MQANILTMLLSMLASFVTSSNILHFSLEKGYITSITFACAIVINSVDNNHFREFILKWGSTAVCLENAGFILDLAVVTQPVCLDKLYEILNWKL